MRPPTVLLSSRLRHGDGFARFRGFVDGEILEIGSPEGGAQLCGERRDWCWLELMGILSTIQSWFDTLIHMAPLVTSFVLDY